MKVILVILTLLLATDLLAQNQFDFDSAKFRLKLNSNTAINKTNLSTQKSGSSILLLNSAKVLDSQWRQTNTLFFSLENFALVTRNATVNSQGRVVLNLQHLGKKFLRDDSEAYRNDLSKFLPQVPDANRLCPIFY